MKIEKQNLNEQLKQQLNIAAVIGRFSSEQTLTTIGELRKLGVGLKILKNNKWERLSEYKLPFERFILLYDDSFNIYGIGVY